MFPKKSCGAILSLACAALVFFSCAPKKNGIGTVAVGGQEFKNGLALSEGGAAATVVAKKSPPVEVDSRHDDLDKVLSKMSKRFRGEVSIEKKDYDAFLSDLETVLLDEKSNSRNDISLYYLIDKTHYVAEDDGSAYEPRDLVELKNNNAYVVNKNGMQLRREAYDALSEMGNAARREGIQISVSSAYRSYSYQKSLFQHWVDVDGLEEAERESARAGTSQHQLGVAVDFGSITNDFAYTKQGKWVYANAYKYGWSLSFPQDHEDVTGFRWESWHFRYIGKNACLLQKKWFADIQQYMIEFIYGWKQTESFRTFAEKNGL